VKVVYPHLEFQSFLLFRSPCQKFEMALQQVCNAAELNCCTKSAVLQMVSGDSWNKNRASKVTGGFFHFLLELRKTSVHNSFKRKMEKGKKDEIKFPKAVVEAS